MSLRRHLLLRNVSRDFLLQGTTLQTLQEEEPVRKNVPVTDLDATYDSIHDSTRDVPATVHVTQDGIKVGEGQTDDDYRNNASARSPIYCPAQKTDPVQNRRDVIGPPGTPYTEIEEDREPTRKFKPIPPPLNFNKPSTSSHHLSDSHLPFSPILTGSRHTSPLSEHDDDLVPTLPNSPAAFLSTSTPAPTCDNSMNIPLCNTLADSTIFLNNPECNMCRICHEDGSKETLTSPCHCAGTMGMLHMSCLEKWLGSSNTTKCEICQFKFVVQIKPHSFIWYMREPALKKDRCVMIKDLLITITLCLIMMLTNILCLIFAHRLIIEDKSGPASVLIVIILGATLFFFMWIWFVARKCFRKLRRWQSKYHTLQIKQTTVQSTQSPPSRTIKRPSIRIPSAFKRKKPQQQDIQPQTLHSSYISFSLESYQSYKQAMCNPVYPANEPLLQADENNNQVTSLHSHSSSVISLYDEDESTVIYYQPSEPGATVTYCSETGKLLRETGV